MINGPGVWRLDMLKDNLIMLRNLKGMSQEDIADVIGISRQAYARWEKGDTVPDVEKCAALADYYGVSIDSLWNHDTKKKGLKIAPAPKGKYIFGVVSVSERGQIVIPKEAREVFGLQPGSRLIVLGDEDEGIALMKAEDFEERARLMAERMAFDASKE